MLPILHQLFGFLQEVFSSEQESRKRTREINKLIRQIEYSQTMAEWEEIGKKVRRIKEQNKFRKNDEILNLQKIYNRKGIDLGNRLKDKPSYPRPKRQW